MEAKRKITFVGVSEDHGPESVVSAIKAAVATSLMEAGIPGAVSIPVQAEGISGSIDLKSTVMLGKEPGRVAYSVSGTLNLKGIPLTFRGLARLPKDSCYRIGGRDLQDFQAARKVLDAKKATAKASADAATEESLSEGESTD